MKKIFTLLSITLISLLGFGQQSRAQAPKVAADVSEIHVPECYTGRSEAYFIIENTGKAPVYKAQISFQLNENPMSVKNIEGLFLLPGESKSFPLNELLMNEPGNYSLKLWVSEVNSSIVQQPVYLEQKFGVPSKSIQRRPLFESFTSSTCPPCYSFNVSFFNNFTTTNAGQITLIKYQMNWPGSGDPYYTAEGGVRRSYYGVNSVPALRVDGKSVSTTSTAVTNALTQQLADPSFVVVEGYHKLVGTSMEVVLNFMPYMDYTGLRGHIGVFEYTTRNNVGTNGETTFKHVMMKMMPNAQGTTMNLINGQLYQIRQVVDLQGTFVEDFSNLGVVLFAQNFATKDILQSNYSTPTSTDFLTVNFSKEGGGFTNLPEGTIYYVQDGTVSLNAVSNDQWEFEKWVIDGEEVFEAQHEFTITESIDVQAVFTEILQVFSVEISVEGEGTVDPEPGTYNYTEGETLTLTASVDEESYWKFYKWIINSMDHTQNPLEYTVAQDLNVVAVFQNTEFVNDFSNSINLSVFPNPTSGRLVASFSDYYENVEVTLINSQGQTVKALVRNQVNSGSEIEMNLGSLAEGIYFLQLQSNDLKSVFKIALKK